MASAAHQVCSLTLLNSRLLRVEFIRQINRRTQLLLGLLFSLSLLCSQGVDLHVHELDHAHDRYLDHNHTAGETCDKKHFSQAHSAHDLSHQEHHEGAIYGIDANPDSTLKKISNFPIVLALFILLFVILLIGPSRPLIYRRLEYHHRLYDRHLLSPPLRAPPL